MVSSLLRLIAKPFAFLDSGAHVRPRRRCWQGLGENHCVTRGRAQIATVTWETPDVYADTHRELNGGHGVSQGFMTSTSSPSKSPIFRVVIER